ncbi:MAG: SDR family NAD(P)-dependent oxidoreductase [Alphaproteobacteria bacterium]|nr:SDR family NAD(P)-dependent oxidoreductase [Alphaproteobacteria bacterium]
MAYSCALVTGATSGIGRSFAELLPSSTNLVLTGRAEDRLLELKDALSRDGRQVETIAADLAEQEGRVRVIAAAEAANVDLLINNAGLGRFGVFVENPAPLEREMVEVNVVAPVVLTRSLLPNMITRAEVSGQRAGVIVLSSVAGFQALPFFGTYAATKSFDLLFAEALSAELADSLVDVLALCPGATRTEFFNRANLADSAMPYMIDADTVARRGLSALGKRTIEVTDPVRRTMMAPSLAFRALKRAVTTMVMRRLGN